jgi:hypothetical protein
VSRTDRGAERSGSWAPLLAGALGAAVVSAAVIWFVVPRTPDPFSAAGNGLAAATALPAGSQATSQAAGLPVYIGGPASTSPAGPATSVPGVPPQTSVPGLVPSTSVPGVPSSIPGSIPSSPGTPSPHKSRPSKKPTPKAGRSSGPQTVAYAASAAAGLPTAAIARDVARAYAYSPAVAVEIGRNDSFAVAPVIGTSGPSAIPLLLATALLAALACLSGALFSRRQARWEPATGPGPLPPPGTEPVARSELGQLRGAAQQKAALARSVAELLPSMPDALVWRAEKALAEVGVRSIVPDGQPFDEAAHHVVGTEPVPHGGRENIIARTIRPGYADGDQILVYPKVIVYTDDAGGRSR